MQYFTSPVNTHTSAHAHNAHTLTQERGHKGADNTPMRRLVHGMMREWKKLVHS